jgi:hypothetical protein
MEKFGSLRFSLHQRVRAMSFPIIEKAKRQAYLCFSGIAIPCDKSTADGGMIRSEKVLKFNRSAMRDSVKTMVEKVDPRMGLGEDTMIVKVGKPGSRERVEALRSQYEATLTMGEEISPFAWEG